MRFRAVRTASAGALGDIDARRYPNRTASDLVVGREYVAMGIGYWRGELWVEVATDGGFLISVSANELELINGRSSALWELRLEEGGEFRLWPSSFYGEFYHSDLADRVDAVVKDFDRVRLAIEREDERRGLSAE